MPNSRLRLEFAQKAYNDMVQASTMRRDTDRILDIESSARKALQGMDLAQYLMVVPLINTLRKYLPKNTAKDAYKDVWDSIVKGGFQYFTSVRSDKEDILDEIVYNNRNALLNLGIPKEQLDQYGGLYSDT